MTKAEGDGGKSCSMCKTWKPFADFNFRFDRPTPRPRSECRECQKARKRAWAASPSGVEWSESYTADPSATERLRAKRRSPEGLAAARERHKAWRDTPDGKAKLAIISKRSQSKPGAKAKRAATRKARYRSSPEYHVEVTIRAMLGRVLKAAGAKKTDGTLATLGYTAEQFRLRIECQFLPGMSWANRAHDTWHIDHRKPVAAFMAQGTTDPKTINALCNLRPMWAGENMRKGASWPLAVNQNTIQNEATRDAA